MPISGVTRTVMMTIALLALSGAGSSAMAADDDDAPAAVPAPPVPADPAATKVITPSFSYDGALVDDVRGGQRRGSTYVGNMHLRTAIAGAPIGMPGVAAYLDLMNLHGGQPVDHVGDAQGVSNLAGPSGTQIEELWIQYDTARRGTSWLIGIYDLNSEFYRLLAAGLFQASPFGIGAEFAQSGVEGPSIFPRTSAGIRFAFKPSEQSVVRFALLDGVPVVRPDGSRALFQSGDGLLGVAEVALMSRAETATDSQTPTRDRAGRLSSSDPYRSKLAIGVWRYTGKFDDLSERDANGDPKRIRGSSGAYLVGEKPLFGDDGSRGRKVSGFVQMGVADLRMNRFESYVGLGVVASGWGWMRGTDEMGLAVDHARNGTHYTRGQILQTSVAPRRAETTVEVTYLSQLAAHLSVQPALQYVVNPNTDRSLRNACVFQLRFEVTF